MQTRLVGGIDGISGEQEDFYRSISLVCDPKGSKISDPNIYYDNYLPSLKHFEQAIADIADNYWLRTGVEMPSQWPPACVNDAIKRGIRAGYAWSKTELSHG